MRAALRFVRELENAPAYTRTSRVCVDLYGSLALTGHGHGTDRAVLLGLSGYAPDTVETERIESILASIRDSGILDLDGALSVRFNEPTDLLFHRDQMYPEAGAVSHPNGMRFTAFNGAGAVVATEVFYSVGGGFILSDAERVADLVGGTVSTRVVPYPFRSAAELLQLGESYGTTIAEIVLANECALYSAELRNETSPRIRRPGLTSHTDMEASAALQRVQRNRRFRNA